MSYYIRTYDKSTDGLEYNVTCPFRQYVKVASTECTACSNFEELLEGDCVVCKGEEVD